MGTPNPGVPIVKDERLSYTGLPYHLSFFKFKNEVMSSVVFHIILEPINDDANLLGLIYFKISSTYSTTRELEGKQFFFKSLKLREHAS